MNDGAKLLTKSEASRFLRCSSRTVDRYRAQGIIRAVKLGGKALFKESDLQAVVNRHIER